MADVAGTSGAMIGPAGSSGDSSGVIGSSSARTAPAPTSRTGPATVRMQDATLGGPGYSAPRGSSLATIGAAVLGVAGLTVATVAYAEADEQKREAEKAKRMALLAALKANELETLIQALSP